MLVFKKFYCILLYYDYREVGNDRIQQVVFDLEDKARDKILYNKGRTGRGQEYLSKQQMDKCRFFTSLYPDVDFSLIGL